MSNILNLSGKVKNKSIVTITYHSLSKKWIERKAEDLHNEILGINDAILKGVYIIHTTIYVDKKKGTYELLVSIKFFKDRKKHEHKKNSHRQEVNI